MSFVVSLLLGLLCLVTVTLITLFDALKIIRLERRAAVWLHLLLIPHFLVIGHYMFKFIPCPVVWLLVMISLFGYVFIKLLALPTGRQNVNSRRLYIMYDGIWQLAYCIVCHVIQFVFYWVLIACGVKIRAFFIPDLVITLIFTLILGLSGTIRICIASKKINALAKAFCIVAAFIPFVSLIAQFLMYIAAYREYKQQLHAEAEREIEITGTSCRTRYPILMVHGVGFRDRDEFNYWGRIPTALKQNGASVFYGEQDGWASVESNAPHLKAKILDILDKTGSDKINVIAHSKGGLDVRYVISCLGMDDKIASLTTISTPHMGVPLADFLVKMPKPLFRLLNKMVNDLFRKRGDNNPEFMKVAYDFTTEHAVQFNTLCPDSPNVYYQSYATVMRSPFSSSLTFVPYIIVRLLTGEDNDGLVTESSTHWGNFRGTMRNNYRRGISHADAIDLSRADYKGFSIVEKYTEIVSDLKERGF